MTNPLTKTEAALLYGYGYRLVDAQSRVWLVQGSLKESLSIIQVAPREGYMPELIDACRVGTDYHVLVHPLSRLTTEIEGIGVAIVELAKIAFPKITDWNLRGKYKDSFSENCKMYFQFHEGDFESEIWMEYEGGGCYDTFKFSNQQSLFAQMYAWHFDCCNFIERGIGKEITLK